MVKLTNLTKIYKTANGQQKALNNVSFELASNGIVFVVGKSGSGKTTMMNLIGGLDFASNGQIIVDGNEITKFNEGEYENYRNSHVGFVFQDFFLLENLTVKENIEVSLKLQNKEVEENEINKILNLVDLDGLASRYPNELSGGQKQRVAIAGIIAMLPQCIVFDEATSMLDPSGRKEVMAAIEKLNKENGITIIHITHNMSEAINADRVIVVNDGRICMNDKPKAVFSNVSKLHQIGLDVPQVTELFYELKSDGIHLPTDIIDINEGVEALASLLK